MTGDDADRLAVGDLLGRSPQGSFDVVVRDPGGGPVVIRNAPWLDDGTPMPTTFWLVGRREVLAVSRLESAGGVRRAEATVDPTKLAAAHERYAAERDRVAGSTDADRPRPTGGVAGTRRGVKCLHAHYAWHLAGGDDPVGRWVAAELAARLDVEVVASTTTFSHAGHDRAVPIGPATLLADQLRDPDPARPDQLTNAIGAVTDHVDDVVRDHPAVLDATRLHLGGDEATHLAVVERGGPLGGSDVTVGRDAVEELFRVLATEDRPARLANPGLDPDRVDSVLATCCIVVGVMRRLQLDQLVVTGG